MMILSVRHFSLSVPSVSDGSILRHVLAHRFALRFCSIGNNPLSTYSKIYWFLAGTRHQNTCRNSGLLTVSGPAKYGARTV